MVRVDEPRRYHVVGRVDDLRRVLERLPRDGDDTPAADSKVADLVEQGLRIHYPPVANDDVVVIALDHIFLLSPVLD